MLVTYLMPFTLLAELAAHKKSLKMKRPALPVSSKASTWKGDPILTNGTCEKSGVEFLGWETSGENSFLFLIIEEMNND